MKKNLNLDQMKPYYMTEELKIYKDELLSLINKSQDHFEKQLSYISSGAIGITILLVEKTIEKFSSSSHKYLILFSWLLFAFSLLTNLISHLLAFKYHSKTIEEINGNNYKNENPLKRNKIITIINYFSVGLIFTGIILSILYFFENL